jgi:signal peptidase I
MSDKRDRAPVKGKLRKIARELLILAAVVVVSLAARSAIADHYYIPSESMEFSFVAGDRVLVDKRAYGLRIPFTDIEIYDRRTPTPGEIVVFDSPESGVRLIKRVVAVGGDRVQVIDGRLFVDGKRLPGTAEGDTEVYGERVAYLNLSQGGGPDMEEIVVPEGHVMVMGDYRGNSRDSRAFGFLRETDLFGRAFRLYYRRSAGFVWRPI